MTTRTTLFATLASLALAGCGSTPDPDTEIPDATGIPIVDAMIDAMPMPVAGPDRHGLVSAAGQLTGGDYTLVFELGHATGQETRIGGDYVLGTATSVEP